MMKSGRYSDELIVRILREIDKDAVLELAEQHGVICQGCRYWKQVAPEQIESPIFEGR